MNGLSYRIKDKANELGLFPVGIAKATPLEEARIVWQELIQSGWRIPFTTGDISQRINPRSVWPTVESLVMVGLPYRVPLTGPVTGDSLRGYFAAGTYENDYHKVLKNKLTGLGTFLQKEVPGAKVFLFVDTGPLAERALAYCAGLGVWGTAL